MQPVGISSHPVALGHDAAPGPAPAHGAWHRRASRARAPPCQARAPIRMRPFPPEQTIARRKQ